jgi:hypothetical protein
VILLLGDKLLEHLDIRLHKIVHTDEAHPAFLEAGVSMLILSR